MVEHVVRVVRGLHVYQPLIDGFAVRLADSVGIFVAAARMIPTAFSSSITASTLDLNRTPLLN